MTTLEGSNKGVRHLASKAFLVQPHSGLGEDRLPPEVPSGHLRLLILDPLGVLNAQSVATIPPISTEDTDEPDL